MLLSDRLDPLYNGFVTFVIILGYADIFKDILSDNSLIVSREAFGILYQSFVYVLYCYICCLPTFVCKSLIMTIFIWTIAPIIFIYSNNINTVIGGVFAGYGIAIGLKMISFVIKSTKNSTLNSFLYFLIAPTLCYQESLVRTTKINLRYSLFLLIQFILCVHILCNIIIYKAKPHLHGNLNLPDSIEFAIYAMIAWIVGFYGFFHCYLPMIAEVVMLKDRNYYSDWWNAQSVQEFWQKWNIPMHKWFKEHILFRRYKRMIIFVVSAVLHEYVVAVPTRKIHLWPMLAILCQYPLLLVSQRLTSRLEYPLVKNALNWILLCIFGPMTLHCICKH